MTSIAIDGPAGAGKSTVARAVARRLGFRYVDTGAMYRVVALAALRRGIDPSDADALTSLASRLELDATEERVTLDGEDVTAAIRSPEVTAIVSTVSAHGGVRACLVSNQRTLAERSDVVMEGRDIGSVVLPDADLKVYLTASLGERAVRRARELGTDASARAPEEVMTEIAHRDAADSTRSSSPLTKAEGAVVIDSTDRTVDDIVGEIAALLSNTGGGPGG